MTKHQINCYLAALIETLNETEFVPEGLAYAAMMNEISLEEFNLLKSILLSSSLAESIGSNCLQITDKGRMLARNIDQFRNRAV